MKSFTELFTAARAISTPTIAVRTFDNQSTIATVTKSLGNELYEATPCCSWDSIHGLKGLNDAGTAAVGSMCAKADDGAGVDRAATVDMTITLAVIEEAEEDVIVFMHNPQLVWNSDKRSVQGIANLRNPYKANGNMLVLLIGIGDELPAELQQDVLVIDEPLPTRNELAKIVTDTFAYAAQKKEYSACKTAATPEVVKLATDAGIGLPNFPFEQAVSLNLNMTSGKLDFDTLWSRKKDIVSMNPGLSYHKGTESLKDMYGCESWVKFGTKLMNGPYRPTVIVRMDEIQRQLAGSESDSSGTKGNLMGEFLTWVNDKKILCTLGLGVSGTSKSWGPYCLGGEYGIPIINYNVSAMEHKHVGESSRHMRTAHRVLESISDCNIWLIASANSLAGLPPELISRFQKGGIYFFDLPDEAEKNGILDLKIKMYGLDSNQARPEMNHWTGRDIDNCCGRAQFLGISLVEAAADVIPLHQSHNAMIEDIRSSASGRYLSASKPGTYVYTPTVKVNTPSVKVVEGRKMR